MVKSQKEKKRKFDWRLLIIVSYYCGGILGMIVGIIYAPDWIHKFVIGWVMYKIATNESFIRFLYGLKLK
jgi:hypothetical protein